MKVKDWVEQIIHVAMSKATEDIHFLPIKDGYQVYLRVAGELEQYDVLTNEMGERVIRYLKYMANMDVGEQRLPQDGSLVMPTPQGELELRLSTITNYRLQESLVIRLLYANTKRDEPSSTMAPEQWEQLFNYCHRKSGLIIFSGPVSSGKTTTIYQLLSALYDERPYSILTMEDPVEIKDERFLQAEVNEVAGVTYERLIRSSLRHHPDILVIGEIRDEETAHMVMRAALTGHLVIATVHARDSIGVLGRLEELGVTREQMLQTLLLITSQRLLPGRDRAGRVALFEILTGTMIQTLLLTHRLPENFCPLNTLLEEAYRDGRISQHTAQSYQVETVVTL
ncbi:MAG: competence type IV pilus ATPase ComGA [Aerococcus sp.]|nr:competence type IV pilus ATPase ComGA [Aerococcus sp.]